MSGAGSLSSAPSVDCRRFLTLYIFGHPRSFQSQFLRTKTFDRSGDENRGLFSTKTTIRQTVKIRSSFLHEMPNSPIIPLTLHVWRGVSCEEEAPPPPAWTCLCMAYSLFLLSCGKRFDFSFWKIHLVTNRTWSYRL